MIKPKPLPEELRRWSNTPSVNPRYKGATPADMARALLRKKPNNREKEKVR